MQRQTRGRIAMRVLQLLVLNRWPYRLALAMALGCASQIHAADSGRSIPIPCFSSPPEAAISFFEFIESPQGFEQLQVRARDVFSRTFMERQSLSEVGALLDSAK